MHDLEKKLNNLPKAKLGKRADFRMRYLIYKSIFIKFKKEFNSIFHFEKHAFAVMVSLLLMFSIIVGVPGYAYASNEVTNGHFLYPIKKVVEKVEFTFTFSDDKKSEKLEKFAQRRFAEAEIISEEIMEDELEYSLVETIEEALQLKKQAKNMKTADGLDDKKNTNKQDKEIKILSNIAEQVGIGAEEKVLDTVAEALDNAKNKQVKEQKETSSMPQKKNINKQKLDEGEQKELIIKSKASFGRIKQEAKKLEEDLSSEGYNLLDVEILSQKLNFKIKKSEKALEKNDIEEVERILESVEALSNNAKHFIKKNNNGNSGKNKK